MQLATLVKKLVKSRMLTDSAVLWAGMMAANVSNYLFHLLMGRFLGPSNYGVLASLVSVMYIILVPTATIQTVVMKFAAEFKAEEDYARVRALLSHLSRRFLVLDAGLFVGAVLASRLISDFLNIGSALPMVLLSTVFIVAYLVPINRGILQGMRNFPQLSFNISLETVLKLLIGFTLVYLGLTVNGAVIGIAAGMLVAYGVSFIPLRFLFGEHEVGEIHLAPMARYSIPVFVALLCATSYYSADIIIVKHFFNSVQAGLYSGLAILGKIVMFASLAVAGVMFPAVAALHKKEQEHRQYLAFALAMVFGISGVIVAAYFAAPSLVIRVLFGGKYAPVAPYLGAFGVAMLLLSLAMVLINYYLAIHRTSFVYFLVTLAFLQIALIWFFHASIGQVVFIMILTMSVLFTGLVLYYFAARVGAKPVPTEGPPPPTFL